MPLFRIRLYSWLLFLSVGFVLSGSGQEDADAEVTSSDATEEIVDAGIVPKLTIAREDIPNFLSDEQLIANHSAAEEGEPQENILLEGVFSVGSDSSRFQIFWDPVSCRLLGVRDLDPQPIQNVENESENDDSEKEEVEPTEEKGPSPETEEPEDSTAPSPYVLFASGPAPLENTSGGGGDPAFFGMRLVHGTPEFLYQRGSLLVEERLWLENGGRTLQQQFTLRDMSSSLVVELPESWKERVTADRGEWKGVTLTVPKEESGELRLTYRLAAEEQKPEETESEKAE